MSHPSTAPSDVEQYQRLVQLLSPEDRAVYDRTRNGRVETVRALDNLIVYRCVDNHTAEVSVLGIEPLKVDGDGLSMGLTLGGAKKRVVVGYAPVRLFDFPVFVSLPMGPKVRAKLGPNGATLSWPLYIRTLSRHYLREEGVTYCETEHSFKQEFGTSIE